MVRESRPTREEQLEGRESFVKWLICNTLEESPELGLEFYRKILQPLAFPIPSCIQPEGRATQTQNHSPPRRLPAIGSRHEGRPRLLSSRRVQTPSVSKLIAR